MKQSAVRETRQRILGGEPRDMRFRLAPLGNVGKGLHKTAVGEMSAAHFHAVPFGMDRSQIETCREAALVAAPSLANAGSALEAGA